MLKKFIPDCFMVNSELLANDKQFVKWHKQLLENLGIKVQKAK